MKLVKIPRKLGKSEKVISKNFQMRIPNTFINELFK